jgi:hypothetical protein
MKASKVLFSIALVAAAPMAAHAQSISALFGGYLPATNVQQVTTNATTVAQSRQGTLSLGANLDMSYLRISAAYASGTTIQNASRQDVGKGNVLGAAADVVIRPIPRILVQPYLIAGAGEKFFKYDSAAVLANGTPQKEFAVHGGVGADVMLGGVGVAAELTDFVSRDADRKFKNHDAFLMVGMKLKL